MAKIKKAFGIYQDGNDIKVALLQATKDRVSIVRLYKDSLVTDKDKEFSSEGNFENFNDFDFNDFGNGDDFKYENEEEKKNDSPYEEFVEDENETDSFKDILEDIAREMDFHEAPISLNLDIDNVFYNTLDIDPRAKKKKILDTVKTAFSGTKISKTATFSYIKKKNDDKVVGIVNDGPMNLLENLYELSNNLNNKSFHFSHIIPDEIALVNMVNFNYDLPEDEVAAVFYIGDNYSRITLLQDKMIIFSLPIINEGFRSHDIVNTLYSRFRFEKSGSDLPDIQHIFVAGHINKEETLNTLQKFESDIKIIPLLPLQLETEEFEAGESEYGEEELSEFIIPISLALSTLFPENDNIFIPDLLPKSIKETQNNLSIGFGGLLVLTLILAMSLISVRLNWKENSDIKRLKNEIQALHNGILINKPLLDSIKTKEKRIAELKKNIERVHKFMGNKNQWHFILEEISKGFLNNSLTWGINLHKEKNQFKLSGSTTRRINIVALSQLFPGGKILKVVQRDIEAYKVWDFDILFNMPDPLITKRLDMQREGIVYNVRKKGNKKENKKELKKQNKTDESVMPSRKKAKSNLKGNSLYKEAVKLSFDRKYNDAVALFDKFLETNPGKLKPNALYFKGECYFGLSSFKEAISMFNKVLEINKAKQPEALLMLGKSYARIGKKDSAVLTWNKLIKKYPKSKYADIAKRKLMNYRKSGKKSNDKSASSSPPKINENIANMINTDSYFKPVNENYDQDKLMITHADYKKAINFYHRKNFREAVEAFKSYIEQNDNPLIVNATYYLGESYYALGIYSSAKDCFQNVIRYDREKLPESYFMLGKTFMRAENKNDAVKIWETLVKKFPTSAYSKQAQQKIERYGA
ncbi:MAG: hypothetical protein CSB55_06515 [Candidatus Cloacimonadota bacterium]|nr:MAG: hypothetical protein CSB55_06515 [Candidatus Cloacimonadota bacterium]